MCISGSVLSEDEIERVKAVLQTAPRALLFRVELDLGTVPPHADAAVSPQPLEPQRAQRAAAEKWLRERMSVGTRSTEREMFSRMSSLIVSGADVLAEAWSIENLAAQFPPTRTSSLAPADRDLLENMVGEHLRSASGRLSEIDIMLGFPAGDDPHPLPKSEWQLQAPAVRQTAQQVCDLIIRLFASGGSTEDPDIDPATTELPKLLRDLRAELSAFDQAAARACCPFRKAALARSGSLSAIRWSR